MQLKKYLQHIGILFFVIIGLILIISSLPQKFDWVNDVNVFYVNHINPYAFAMHGLLSFILGAMMIFVAYRLYKKVRMAWIIEMASIFLVMSIQIFRFKKFTIPIIIIEIIVMVILSLTMSRKDFLKNSNKSTIKIAATFFAVSLSTIFLNTFLEIFSIRHNFSGMNDVIVSFKESFNLLILMDKSDLVRKSSFVFANLLIFINWSSIIIGLILLLNPVIKHKKESKFNVEKARKIVLEHGQNPMSYLALEDDKKYFFGKDVNGVVAYTIIYDVLVCCGDIICDEKDAYIFLGELMMFCKKVALDIIFINVTDKFLDLYKSANFGIVKYGEDATFDLSKYNLVGGKVAKVRAAINHANKKGIKVFEYEPNLKRDYEVENEIREISAQWLKGKNSVEMSFMLGGIGLENPMERRYFCAYDDEEKMLGFVVFIPYLNKKGYLADVTRRRNDAPQGVLEKIIYDGFMKMKEEGCEWGNMGLSPLYGVACGDKIAFTERLFGYIYNNLNRVYDFQALHHSKKKYAPTDWQPRYIAYNPKIFSPQFAFAIVKSQNPKSITEFLPQFLSKKSK